MLLRSLTFGLFVALGLSAFGGEVEIELSSSSPAAPWFEDCPVEGDCAVYCERPNCWKEHIYGRHDLYPYVPCYPATGYYYFHPYHPMHIVQHQAFVASYGEDPRMPYANTLFERLHASVPTAPPALKPPAVPVPIFSDEPPAPPVLPAPATPASPSAESETSSEADLLGASDVRKGLRFVRYRGVK